MMNASAMLHNLPLDGSMECVLRPYKKLSSNQQRRRMFGYVVGEIASQAWLQGKQYSAEVWHEFLKAKFLPETHQDGITREGYMKYMELPDGSIKMVGSTTQLTTLGHTNYVTECEAFAVQELGVRFSAEER
jgi:hypothetical protein